MSQQLLVEIQTAGRSLGDLRSELRAAGASEVPGFAPVPDRTGESYCFTIEVESEAVLRAVEAIEGAALFGAPEVAPARDEEPHER